MRRPSSRRLVLTDRAARCSALRFATSPLSGTVGGACCPNAGPARSAPAVQEIMYNPRSNSRTSLHRTSGIRRRVAGFAAAGAVLLSPFLGAGTAAAADDATWDALRPVREHRQLGHQHRERLLRRPPVLGVHLGGIRRHRVRPAAPTSPPASSRSPRREDAGGAGLGRLAGLLGEARARSRRTRPAALPPRLAARPPPRRLRPWRRRRRASSTRSAPATRWPRIAAAHGLDWQALYAANAAGHRRGPREDLPGTGARPPVIPPRRG